MMDYIKVNEHLKLPLIGLGTFGIPQQRFEDVIKHSLSCGYQLFDTARKYANEEVLGTLLKDNDSVVVETKCDSEFLRGNTRFLWLNGHSVSESLAQSQKKLNRDIDVLMIHTSPFKGYEKFYRQLVDLKLQQKIKAFGICNVRKDDINQIYQKTGIFPDIVQVEVHPYFTNADLIAFCRKNKIVVEARSPFAHGDVMGEWENHPVLKRLADRYGKSVPQIILRWIVQQQIIAMPRSSSISHLSENIDIFDFSLNEEDMSAISALNRNLSFGCLSVRR